MMDFNFFDIMRRDLTVSPPTPHEGRPNGFPSDTPSLNDGRSRFPLRHPMRGDLTVSPPTPHPLMMGDLGFPSDTPSLILLTRGQGVLERNR